MRPLLHILLITALLMAPGLARAAIEPATEKHAPVTKKYVAPAKIAVRITHRVGTILELAVSCGRRTQIVSFSPIDRRYCNARHQCASSLSQVISKSCFAPPMSAFRQ